MILTPQSADEATEAGQIACTSNVPVYVRLPTSRLLKSFGQYADEYWDVPFRIAGKE